MSLGQTLKIAWEGLALNKGRTFLTTLGVIIGVAAVIIMMAVSAGAEAAIAEQIDALGANLIMILPSFSRGGFGREAGPPPSLTYKDLSVIAQQVSGISGVSAERDTSQTVTVGSVTLDSISVVGTTSGFTAVREYGVVEGRFVNDGDNTQVNRVAVLGYAIAEQLFGDTLTGAIGNPVGQTIQIGTSRFVVIGVMAKKGVVGNTNYDDRVYVPITVIFQLFTNARFGRSDLGVVYVSAVSKQAMASVESQLSQLLMQLLGTTSTSPGFTLVTQDNIIVAQESTTATFRNLLAWVAGVSLVVGGIGIMNIMLVSVTERTREIGLRQALGARPRDVRFQFLSEAVALSLIGGLVGVLVGAGGSILFNALSTTRTQLVWSSLPLAFCAAAAVGIFFGYYPATKAAQLDPIVALRHE
jgi:putative ABC transport system permease protein